MFNQSPNAVFCLCCLQPDVAELRIDRKGRPYTHCRACTSKTFIYHPDGLMGLSFLAPRLTQLLSGYSRDELRQSAAEYVASRQRSVA